MKIAPTTHLSLLQSNFLRWSSKRQVRCRVALAGFAIGFALATFAQQTAIAAAPARANPREGFAQVLRELGDDLTGEHPIMDGRPHRMATLDDDRGEKSIFYVAHADGRTAGYAKNNRTGEEQPWKASAVTT
jgi:hypothetical protein